MVSLVVDTDPQDLVFSDGFDPDQFESLTIRQLVEIREIWNEISHGISTNLVAPARLAHKLADLMCQVLEAVTIYFPENFKRQMFKWRLKAGLLLNIEDQRNLYLLGEGEDDVDFINEVKEKLEILNIAIGGKVSKG